MTYILKLFSLFLLLFTTVGYSQTTIKHKVTKGESIYTIAKKYNVKEAEIFELNPETQGKYLQLNATLLIPNKNFEDTIPKTHKVVSGETLNIIAEKYHLKLSALQNLNPTIDSRRLKIGTVLKLSSSEIVKTDETIETDELIAENATAIIEKTENTHSIASGETLGIIAKKYNLSLSKLMDLNPTIDSKRLKIGTVIKLSNSDDSIKIDDLSSNTFEAFKLKTHKIKSGETLKVIAKKYQLSVKELRDLNPKLDPRKLKIGTVVTLNKPDTLSVNKNKIEINNSIVIDETKDLIHKVLANETKYGIAKKYGVSVEKLDELNPEIVDKLPVDYFLIIKRGTNSEVLTPEIIKNSKNAEITSLKIEILIDEASKKIGTPYRSGGTTTRGFDCSGLMYTTFKEINMTLPRSSRGMANYGTKISKSDAKKGDLIFFTTNRRGSISHVGMITEIIGDEIKFIHSSTSLGVIISSIKEAYYLKRFVQINRIL